MLAAFATVGVIEFRTVLAMLGFEVTATVYFPVAALLIVAVLVGLLMLPDGEEPPGSDDGGPSEGNVTEAQTGEDPTSAD
jgi:hypothetical protein